MVVARSSWAGTIVVMAMVSVVSAYQRSNVRRTRLAGGRRERWRHCLNFFFFKRPRPRATCTAVRRRHTGQRRRAHCSNRGPVLLPLLLFFFYTYIYCFFFFHPNDNKTRLRPETSPTRQSCGSAWFFRSCPVFRARFPLSSPFPHFCSTEFVEPPTVLPVNIN